MKQVEVDVKKGTAVVKADMYEDAKKLGEALVKAVVEAGFKAQIAKGEAE